MQFVQALSVMSKSSSFAVSTESDRDEDLTRIKSDLYVAMPIEEDVLTLLDNLDQNSKKVIFLCGSSGDGKSELLLRAKKKFEKPYLKFHLDATHSFSPHDSAIDTLNKIFKEFQESDHSLVIGINIGMLGNYAEEAYSPELRMKLKNYLEKKENSEDIYFINFEDYPKFEIIKEGYKADFVNQLLEKITSSNSQLYKVFEKEENDGLNSSERLKFINYKLLCNKKIQSVLVELLLKARLFRNQFITARTFLDFVYELIAGKGYIFDNLFTCTDNEILANIAEFDPALLRTKSIDRFIMAFDLKTFSEEFLSYQYDLTESFGIEELENSMSYVRLFYLTKYLSLGNNYHYKFQKDFSEDLLYSYLEIYRHHKFYENTESKLVLEKFYSKDLISALRNYINKRAPYLESEEYLIADYNDAKIISTLEIEPDLYKINNSVEYCSSISFKACLTINEDEELDFPIDINFFDLLYRLKSGYRPRKNDRSVAVVLNRIVNQIINFANQSNKIRVTTSTESFRLKLGKLDDIKVAGIK